MLICLNAKGVFIVVKIKQDSIQPFGVKQPLRVQDKLFIMTRFISSLIKSTFSRHVLTLTLSRRNLVFLETTQTWFLIFLKYLHVEMIIIDFLRLITRSKHEDVIK